MALNDPVRGAPDNLDPVRLVTITAIRTAMVEPLFNPPLSHRFSAESVDLGLVTMGLFELNRSRKCDRECDQARVRGLGLCMGFAVSYGTK